MKKNIILLTIAACALFACQKNEIELLEKPIIEQIDGNTYSYTFSATISDNVSEVDEDGTKATVSRAGAYTWAVNDELKFFKSDGASANAKITAVDGSNATITVTTTDPRADFVSAIYPASAAIAKDQISFNARGPIVVSAVSGGTLAFHHIGSVINLKFTSIPAGTENLVFTPETSIGFDGKFTFTERVPSLTAGGSISSIEVPATTSDEGKDITISVPCISLAGGFTVTLKNDSGRNLFKKTTEKTLDLSGGHKLLNMKKVACEAPSIYYMRTSDTRGGNFWSCDIPLLKTGADAHYALANVDKTATYVIFDDYNKVDPGTPVPSEAIIKSGNVLDLTFDSKTFYLLGAVNGWESNDNYAFDKIGDWNYLLNKSDLHNTDFKYHDGSSWWGVEKQGSDTWFNSTIKEYTVVEGGGENNGLYLEGATINLYLNTSTKKVLYRESADKNNPISALVAFTYTPSTNTLTTSVEDDWGIVSPFNDASYPKDTYCFMSNLFSWTAKTLTYNNMIWQYSFTVEAANTYDFLIAKSDYSYKTGKSETWSFVDVGVNGFGRLNTWDVLDGSDGNAHVYLEKGSYILYVNPTYAYDHSVNVQFVKQ